ncbi:MAG: hydantoinase/oxoprolinase family protein [Acidimicrobiales bacterium]|nr:hydantoinase/oxoprolinase family protein [Acidimicrobiales bacterium]
MRIGLDTGGTFTDAALVDADGKVVATAKAPTTHDQLIDGVSAALGTLLSATDWLDVEVITSVALSTTLATNAMVEQTGDGAALVLAGFDPAAIERIGGLDRAAHVVTIGGGHNAQGREVDELDETALIASFDELGNAEAIAVASIFAVRNDAHELRIRSLLASDARTTHLPVTCSHELSGRLDGPRRASTALANARLTAPVRRLIDAFEGSVRGFGIDAPLVVVRSDGSVMSLSHAVGRPVETILSGPAASLVGGLHLAGVRDAVVVDVGGTTTDVAVVSNAIPEVVDDGATVGGVGTMIRSPRITTEGLGGDSEVGWHETGSALRVGPGRVIPLGAAQTRFPEICDRLEAQLERRIVAETDGLFCITADGTLLEASSAFATRRDFLSARRRAASGELRFIALTPTDAVWATGRVDPRRFTTPFEPRASELGLELFAATLNRFGVPRFGSARRAAEAIVAEVERRTGLAVARAVGLPESVWREVGAAHDLFSVAVALDRPIVGVGASASLYHPPLQTTLGTTVIVPEASEVANAVGAAVGSVRVQITASITAPKRAGFVLHRPGPVTSFETLEEAVDEGTRRIEDQLVERYRSSGLQGAPESMQVEINRSDTTVTVDGTDFFVESLLEGTLTHAVGTVAPAQSS